MKITEIIQLLKAGYTKAEIAELKDAETVDPPKSAEPAEEPKASASPAEEPEASASPAPAGPDPEIVELKNMVQNLQKLIQTQNIKNNVRDTVEDNSVDDILASVINGSRTKEQKERNN